MVVGYLEIRLSFKKKYDLTAHGEDVKKSLLFQGVYFFHIDNKVFYSVEGQSALTELQGPESYERFFWNTVVNMEIIGLEFYIFYESAPPLKIIIEEENGIKTPVVRAFFATQLQVADVPLTSFPFSKSNTKEGPEAFFIGGYAKTNRPIVKFYKKINSDNTTEWRAYAKPSLSVDSVECDPDFVSLKKFLGFPIILRLGYKNLRVTRSGEEGAYTYLFETKFNFSEYSENAVWRTITLPAALLEDIVDMGYTEKAMPCSAFYVLYSYYTL